MPHLFLIFFLFSESQIGSWEGGTVGQFWPLGCRTGPGGRTWGAGGADLTQWEYISPYPEVTLDNFSFLVDLTAWLVVLWPPMAKVTIDKVKNVCRTPTEGPT